MYVCMYVCMYVRTYEQCVSMRHFCWYNNFKIFHHEAIVVKGVSQLKFPETNRLQQRKKYQARYDMTKTLILYRDHFFTNLKIN